MQNKNAEGDSADCISSQNGADIDFGLEGFGRFWLGNLIRAALDDDDPPPKDTLWRTFQEVMWGLLLLRSRDSGQTGRSTGDIVNPADQRRLSHWGQYNDESDHLESAWEVFQHNLGGLIQVPGVEREPKSWPGDEWSIQDAIRNGWKVRAKVKRWNEYLNELRRQKVRRQWFDDEARWPLEVASIALKAMSERDFLDRVGDAEECGVERFKIAHDDAHTYDDLINLIKKGELTLYCIRDGKPTCFQGEDCWRLDSVRFFERPNKQALYAAHCEDGRTKPGVERELLDAFRLTNLRVDREQTIKRCSWSPREDNDSEPMIDAAQAKQDQAGASSSSARSEALMRQPARRQIFEILESPDFRDKYPKDYSSLARGDGPVMSQKQLLGVLNDLANAQSRQPVADRTLKRLLTSLKNGEIELPR